MMHKLRQFKNRSRFTVAHKVPTSKARQYLTHHLAYLRPTTKSAALPIATSLTMWMCKVPATHRRIPFRNACFITGRRRGMVRRFGVARTSIKHLAGRGRLLGCGKHSH